MTTTCDAFKVYDAEALAEKPHVIHADNDDTPGIKTGAMLAMVHTADPEKAAFVLNQPTGTMDGRSEFVWVRLPNGDLILGVFPQGDTYFAVEDDAAFPR